MKIYLAAPYSFKGLIAKHVSDIQSHGITVVSDWHTDPFKATIQLKDVPVAQHREYAQRDLSQVLSADVLVYHTDPTSTIVRAGRHVEFGMAAARGIPIYVVGLEYENVFHYLPNVHHFATWPETLAALIDLDASSTS